MQKMALTKNSKRRINELVIKIQEQANTATFEATSQADKIQQELKMFRYCKRWGRKENQEAKTELPQNMNVVRDNFAF